MTNTHTHEFMATLRPGDIIIQPYGNGYSLARYNGVYYDTFQMWDYNPCNGRAAYTKRFTSDTVEVYTRTEEKAE